MPTLVVVGAQWGDEGKGKITDFLSARADTVVRYQGGHNAGHTVVVDGREFRLQLVPSGIVHGKRCVIGNGVVLDPGAFLEEVRSLAERGCDVGRIYVSDAAHLILPYHKELDAAEEEQRGAGRLGTTLRGVGPAYRDKAARVGVRVADLLNPSVFRRKLEANLAQTNELLRKVYGRPGYDAAALAEELLAHAEALRPHVTDTARLINRAVERGERVLFEGAQGTMLDLDHGTYPYVTSSYPTAGGACIGSGVGPGRIDRVIGVAKAYTTRVGDGPFPTELTGPAGDHLRERGREYGVVTGRPRRCGWLDAVALRHAVLVNGLDALCVTKLDTLCGFDRVRVAVAYEYRGRRLEDFPHDSEVLEGCTPVYEELPGWDGDLTGVTRFDDLPKAARAYLERLEALTGVPVVLVSVGADRGQTMQLHDPFSLPRRGRA
jgi:adenylosuccinate synthase